MNTDLQNYTINSAMISDDLFGKEGAQYELSENKNDLIIAATKITFYFLVTALPAVLLVIGISTLSLWYYGTIFSGPAIFFGLVGGLVTAGITRAVGETFFSEKSWHDEKTFKRMASESRYTLQKDKISMLWERRKKLNRFLSVEAERYDSSQAREIAPLLLARIRKHNKLIESGTRMIGLQETLDRNSNSLLAPQLAKNITEKVKAEYNDLRNRLETYEVMKEMTTDMSLDITTALMDIKDFNKSDLDEFLNQQQENIALLTGDVEKDELPAA